MDKRAYDIFISYAREDIQAASDLFIRLRSQGFRPWLDVSCLLPGQPWKEAIRKAIKECRFFLALLSSRSVDKQGFVQKEMRIALDILDEYPPNSVYIIPARLDDCQPTHERLAQLQWVDLFPSHDAGLLRIMQTITEFTQSPLRPRIVEQKGQCLFDLVCSAPWDMMMSNDNVHKLRMRWGGLLAREYPVDADVVVGIPGTGTSAALGYSRESGILLDYAFVPQDGVNGPIIVQMDAEENLKYPVITNVVKGRRVVLLDACILWLSPISMQVKSLRDAGAKETHVRILWPPVSPCFIDDRIAADIRKAARNYNVPEMREVFQCDSLGFLTDSTLESALEDPRQFCMRCIRHR
jgi:hypothetical protein